MDDVMAEKNRNSQPGLFHRLLLHCISCCSIIAEIDQGTYFRRDVIQSSTEVVLDSIDAKY